MRNKLKTTIIIVLIILGVLLSLPYIMGVVVEKQYKKIVTNLNHNPNVNIEITSYHRGWFSSKATTKIVYGKKYNEFPTLKFNPYLSLPPKFTGTITEKIKHGPLIITKAHFSVPDGDSVCPDKHKYNCKSKRKTITKKYLNLARAIIYSESVARSPKITATTTICLWGAINTELKVAKFLYKTAPLTLNSGGLNASIYCDKNLDKIVITLHPNGFIMKSQGFKLVIPFTKTTMIGEKTAPGKWRWNVLKK